MGEDVDLAALVADLRRLQRDEASQAADIIEAWAHLPTDVRRLAEAARESDMGSDPSDDHSTHVHFGFGNLNDYKLLPSTGVLGMRRVVVTSCAQCGAPLVRPVT